MNQPLEISDFSGGKTDNYLAGPLNAAQDMDNLLINKNKKTFSRPGSEIRDSVFSQVPSGVKRISYFWVHRDQQLEQTERFIFYLANSAYTELVGPTGNHAFLGVTEADHISQAFWNNHSLLVSDTFATPIKIFKDDSDVFKLLSAGLPDINATPPTLTSSGGSGSNYIYAFLYRNSYNVEGVVFQDVGATCEVQLLDVAGPDSDTVTISAIPILVNGPADNYDTTNIVIDIYRTQANGTVLTFLHTVTNGTTSYDDTKADTDIVNNQTIYTNGNVVDNDPPPPAKFVHIANDIAIYAYVQELGVNLPNRIRQSLKGDIDSCPVDFIDDYPDELMGINSVQSAFIIFCTNSTFRMENFFDSQGGGGMSHYRISDTYGCVSNDSIVKVDDGLIFCSLEGWCYTDGYKVVKISNHLNDTYPTLVKTTAQARNIWGAYDKIENRVWFTCKKDSGSPDNDCCFILDLHWGISDMSTFTTASNQLSFLPTCLLFQNGNMYRSDKRGYVFKHDAGFLTDPKVDITILASNWNTKTIIYNYASSVFDFGTAFVRKFVPKILLTLSNLTNIAVQMFSINDNGFQTAPLVAINHTSNILWGDPLVIWGNPSIIWDQTGLIEEIRHFPAKNLRCNYKQIVITNANAIVTNSDTLGLVTIDPVLKTATLVNGANSWPQASVDYTLSLVNDNYVTQYTISFRTSDTVVHFIDSTGSAPVAGNYKFLVMGYRKNEVLEMLSYTVHFKMLTSSQKPFHKATDVGGNS